MSRKRIIEYAMAAILLIAAFMISHINFSAAGSGESTAVPVIYPGAGEDGDIVVVIDVGHGAIDSGKVGVNGVLEKDINLAIAKLLKEDLLEQGLTVYLTREDDSPLYSETDTNRKRADMKARIEMMEAWNADIVVSIHQNSYVRQDIKGPQVFYYTGSKDGESLADAIQKGFDYALGDGNTRSIKANKDYYLLVHSKMTAVICECGFLSNPGEAEALNTPEYQKKIAKSICNGIVTYLNQKK